MEKLKTCTKCGKEKPITNYVKSKDGAMGVRGDCRKCSNSVSAAWVKKNRKRVRENHLRWSKKNRTKIREWGIKRRASETYTHPPYNAKKATKNVQKWQESNPEKRKAHNTLNNAVRDGRIKKPDTCSVCGASDCRIIGHHKDHSKPLIVIWICPSCHGKSHRI